MAILQPLEEKQIQTLILGCTHYELVAAEITKILGPQVEVIAEGPVVATKLADYLSRHPDINHKLARNSKRTYFVTDLSDEYQKLTQLFLGPHATSANNLTEIEI